MAAAAEVVRAAEPPWAPPGCQAVSPALPALRRRRQTAPAAPSPAPAVAAAAAAAAAARVSAPGVAPPRGALNMVKGRPLNTCWTNSLAQALAAAAPLRELFLSAPPLPEGAPRTPHHELIACLQGKLQELADREASG
jgi:hypothetical protein